MTDDRIAAFIGRHTTAWNNRDQMALCLNHTVGGVVLSPMFHRVEGRSQICRSYADLFAAFPDWELRYGEPIVSGNRVALYFWVAATHAGDFLGMPGSGRRCALEGVSLFQLSPDFLIEEERRVYDFTGLLVQLGVLRVRVAL